MIDYKLYYLLLMAVSGLNVGLSIWYLRTICRDLIVDSDMEKPDAGRCIREIIKEFLFIKKNELPTKSWARTKIWYITANSFIFVVSFESFLGIKVPGVFQLISVLILLLSQLTGLVASVSKIKILNKIHTIQKAQMLDN